MAFFLLFWPSATAVTLAATSPHAITGWKELSGKVGLTTDTKEAATLSWRFDYDKDPSVLSRDADSVWKSSVSLTFSIKSDIDGRLFMRIDQEGGGIFLANFDATRDWRQISLAYADFQPFGKTTGVIEPARISRVYLVDLNGSDNGLRGSRTVFLKEFNFHDQPPVETAGQKRLPLVAFDSEGRVLDLKGFEALGTSGGRWCYLADENGAALPMKLAEDKVVVDGEKRAVPVIITDTGQPAILQILFWPAGDGFKLQLPARGKAGGIVGGARQGSILINLELARTRLDDLVSYMPTIKVSDDGRLRRFAADLAKAGEEPTLQKQAAAANRLLLEMLEWSRDVVRSASRAAVAAKLGPGPEAPLPSPLASLLKAGTAVTVHLVEPAFHIGIGQGFGFVSKEAAPETVDRYYAELRQLGFNMVTLPLYWDKIVDTKGDYTKWQDQLRFDTLARLGYRFHAHGFVQSGMPENVRKLKGPDFFAAARRHTANLAADLYRRYGGRIQLWQAINEPASNAFGGTAIEERIKLVSDLVGHLRSVVPGAKVVVNDYDWERGLEAERPASLKTITGTLPFYRELMKSANRPDVLALEWYPGARVDRPEFKIDLAEPAMDLLSASLYWDRFIALGRPLIFTESNFPGSMKKSDRNGYAWGRWDSQSQAQAAGDTFLLALSKPEILGWVWWSITDDEPWNPEGGLYGADGRKKPVLDRLATEIAALKKPTALKVARDGKLPMPTMPGTWKISMENGPAWTVKRDRNGNLTMDGAEADSGGGKPDMPASPNISTPKEK